MQDITATLTFTKATKHTNVYSDASDAAPVPSLYIKKHALPQVPPKTLTIIIKEYGP